MVAPDSVLIIATVICDTARTQAFVRAEELSEGVYLATFKDLPVSWQGGTVAEVGYRIYVVPKLIEAERNTEPLSKLLSIRTFLNA